MVKFRTSIDCCKQFMDDKSLPLTSLAPQVGDLVQVHSEHDFEIKMKVISREWIFSKHHGPTLECWLASPNGFSIPEFESILKNRGFNVQ